MGAQLPIPARWATAVQSLANPADRLTALGRDVDDAKAQIREILDELAGKHGVPGHDVTFAMRAVDDALGDLLHDIRSGYEHDLDVDSEPVGSPLQMDQQELRGGHAPWSTTGDRGPPARKGSPVRGSRGRAGITGALMAEHLSAQGRDVCLIDRERPGKGSTAASTAMLLWELDTSLSRLTELYGFERAAEMYRHSFRAVAGLARSVASLGLGSTFRERDSLYIASDMTHGRDLLAEQQLRVRAGLPSRFLDYRPLVRAYAVDREAAILSAGSAEADLLVLARSYVAVAKKHGVAIFDAEAVSYNSTKSGVAVGLDNGATIEAAYVVLATGYSLPEPVQSMNHSVSSTYAIATPPQPVACWRDGVLIWEAQEDYLYARTTLDGRLIIGGEDDDVIDPAARDALIPAKAAKLLEKLHALCPAATALAADFAWAGTFGHTQGRLAVDRSRPGPSAPACRLRLRRQRHHLELPRLARDRAHDRGQARSLVRRLRARPAAALEHFVKADDDAVGRARCLADEQRALQPPQGRF